MAWDYTPRAHPVELLSLSGKLGAQVRATVHSFGPVLLGKVLDLNTTQTSVLSIVFKYCDDNQLLLLDLADLRTTLQFLTSDAAKDVRATYGGISGASVGVLLRSLVTLEQAGAEALFGEPEFDVRTCYGSTNRAKGSSAHSSLPTCSTNPDCSARSCCGCWPSCGTPCPRLVIPKNPSCASFSTRRTCCSTDASEALLDQIEQTARLIRSKGVGVYFVDAGPGDVPASVLAQLGNRIQHALRVFTPQDADNLSKTVKTFPMRKFYDVGETLTSLGTGEALVTVLSARGTPTALAATRLIPPDSRMAGLEASELQRLATGGQIYAKYAQTIDRESAHEMITARIAAAQQQAAADTQAEAAELNRSMPKRRRSRPPAEERARRQAERDRIAEERARNRMLQTVVTSGTRLVTSRAGSDLIRGLLGTFFGGKR